MPTCGWLCLADLRWWPGVGTPEATSRVSFYGQELERSLFISNSGMQSESGRGPDLKTTAGVKLKLHSVTSDFTRHADGLINASRPEDAQAGHPCCSALPFLEHGSWQDHMPQHITACPVLTWELRSPAHLHNKQKETRGERLLKS